MPAVLIFTRMSNRARVLFGLPGGIGSSVNHKEAISVNINPASLWTGKKRRPYLSSQVFIISQEASARAAS